jgi:hypothetical protein
MRVTDKQFQDLGYTVSRGGMVNSYRGVLPDDNAARWYLDLIDSDVADRRGPGYATRAEAYYTALARMQPKQENNQ